MRNSIVERGRVDLFEFVKWERWERRRVKRGGREGGGVDGEDVNSNFRLSSRDRISLIFEYSFSPIVDTTIVLAAT